MNSLKYEDCPEGTERPRTVGSESLDVMVHGTKEYTAHWRPAG
jgi:hypothetical protein